MRIRCVVLNVIQRPKGIIPGKCGRLQASAPVAIAMEIVTAAAVVVHINVPI